MTAFYNEIDPFAAAWLRELIRAGHIADGVVDERPIQEVKPSDVEGFTQAHFFAGIAGWPHALRLAGWPDSRPVWTGSCPCQPFSSASRGRGRRSGDARHLWPVWRELILSVRPGTVFGEQVAQADDWADEVCDDMDRAGYSIGTAILPACGVGQDHVRHRLYFACHTDREGKPGGAIDAEVAGLPGYRSGPRDVVGADGLPARVALLRAFGSAVVPAVAQAFIEAYLDVEAARVPA